MPNSDSEHFKLALDATLRALAQRADIEVTYTPTETLQKKLSLARKNGARLPPLLIKMSENDRNVIRGAADSEGLRLRHHDPDLHQKRAPKDEQARAIHDALELARIESLGAIAMEGVGKNLAAALGEKCTQLGYHNLNNRRNDTLPDALHALLLARITGKELPLPARKLTTLWENWINEKLGTDWQKKLIANIADQKKFGGQTRAILKGLDLIPSDETGDLEGDDTPPPPEDDTPSGKDNCDVPADDQQEHDEDDNSDSQHGASDDTDDGDEDDENPQDESGAGDIATLGDEADDNAAEVKQKNAPPANTPGTSYAIYTKEFDEIINTEDLADPDELVRLRALLDKQMEGMQTLVAKLANRLQRKLLARQQRSWQFDLEEGYLDSSRLARVVANPTVPLSFKQEKEAEFKDTTVTLLLDNSGSMRGRPITIAAMCADILARTLERCGVKVEILGFTTRTWKGGRARDLWIGNGRPDQPGRLNELRHIIYKSADSPYRRTRKNLGLMLKEGLLKENIDGEALVWAYNRIAARNEERKLLLIISDGAPVDDSTLSVNPTNILEHDLHQVIAWIEMIGKVNLSAIGIGHDVTRYYERAITIADATALGEALIDNLSDLFETT
ncbi:MAG: cobaltochelatase subunit CobT [Pseudobdellovibrionaceae bacterium]